VSYWVPAKAATRLSVVGWLAPSEKAEMQVSMMVAPASTPFMCTMLARPEVAWLCRWMGMETAALMAFTNSAVV
jgi:hypothetical protein